MEPDDIRERRNDGEAPPSWAVTPERPALSTLTASQWLALLMLRRRYQVGQDLWSGHELAALRFLRWLRDAGRLTS